jgi:hypothetical protein
MPKFRIIIETDCKNKSEAEQIGGKALWQASVPSKMMIQKMRGKRKPKPNSNKLTIDNYIDKRYTDDNSGA